MAPNAQFAIPNRDTDETYVAGQPSLPVAVEGWNGRVVRGALADFQPEGGALKILVEEPPRLLSLRFNQVKRLRVDPRDAPASLGGDHRGRAVAIVSLRVRRTGGAGGLLRVEARHHHRPLQRVLLQ